MFVDMRLRSGKKLAAHDRAFPAWARKEIRARRLVCFLVEGRDREVVGGGSVWLKETHPHPGSNGGKVPYLMSMYTAPEHRGRGIATMVVKHAVKWARRKGYGTMTLHASKMGRPVYERLGWHATTEMGLRLGRLRPRSRRSGR